MILYWNLEQRFATENGLNAVISGAQTSNIGDGRHYYDLRKVFLSILQVLFFLFFK